MMNRRGFLKTGLALSAVPIIGLPTLTNEFPDNIVDECLGKLQHVNINYTYSYDTMFEQGCLEPIKYSDPSAEVLYVFERGSYSYRYIHGEIPFLTFSLKPDPIWKEWFTEFYSAASKNINNRSFDFRGGRYMLYCVTYGNLTLVASKNYEQ